VSIDENEEAVLERTRVGIHTVENGVGNQAARIDGYVANGTEWVAVAVVEVFGADELAQELVRVEALDIATVVLVKVGEAVVEEDGRLEFDGNVELDDALALIEDVVEAGVLDEGVAGGRWDDVVAAGAKTI
jgi:hypothetical protein